MVKSVEVKNFKSIVDLKLELGRVNVFIGENGSGKSNILEAVAFGAAASANKLDKEFLASRGMRVPEPKLMRSAFSKDNLDKIVYVVFEIDHPDKSGDFFKIPFRLQNGNDEFSKWEEESKSLLPIFTNFLTTYIFSDIPENKENDMFSELKTVLNADFIKSAKELKSRVKSIDDAEWDGEKQKIFSSSILDKSQLYFFQPFIQKFKIYAPENTFLRKFEDEEAGDPLGIKGEGLFRLLRYFQNHEDKSYIRFINEALSALDWFDSFDISNDLYPGERRLSIVDRFLDSDVSISQNSANEGFLFILFYISLFVSEDAPPFFAIDNIDASFNPKLCKHITQILVNAAKKSNKQALFTTHNPFILDGLDLTDDEQRLFVVYRTQKGHTIAKRVEANERKMPLSEQWMEGLLGGLPENF